MPFPRPGLYPSPSLFPGDIINRPGLLPTSLSLRIPEAASLLQISEPVLTLAAPDRQIVLLIPEPTTTINGL